jgi:hypothetical protein
MKEIHFVDTTLRDGQLSLWASNMTTGMMLPIVENMNRIQQLYQKIEKPVSRRSWLRAAGCGFGYLSVPALRVWNFCPRHSSKNACGT